MPRIRSLIEQVGIDTAGRGHDCQGNGNHRIAKGDLRLKVRNGRSWDHYCCSCAETIIARDIQKLIDLQGELAARIKEHSNGCDSRPLQSEKAQRHHLTSSAPKHP
jgi:hypothetical protein